MYKVLFVCTGNTCRSVMAEWIFNHQARAQGLEEKLKADSAGINAIGGMPAAPYVKDIALQEGFYDKSHMSQQVKAERLIDYDIILVMTYSHKQEVKNMMAEAREGRYPPVFLLKEYVQTIWGETQNGKSALDHMEGAFETVYSGNDIEIPDPIGGDKKDYQKLYQELYYLIGLMITYLSRQLAEE